MKSQIPEIKINLLENNEKNKETESESSRNTTLCNSAQNESISEIISELLLGICEENLKNTSIPRNILSKFYTIKRPNISLSKYIERIQKYINVQDSTLILILIYIDKLCGKFNISLNFLNIYKLIFGAMITALKYNEDSVFEMDYLSKVCGISLKEAKELEFLFIILIKFDLYVKEETYEQYYQDVISYYN